MKISQFDFDLPADLIAQEPSIKRDHSKLLIVSSDDKSLIETEFYNITDYLQAGDLIVFNNSKVIKAKIILHKQDRKIEFYLTKRIDEYCWRGFAKPAKKLLVGDKFPFDNNEIHITKKLAMGETEIKFQLNGLSVLKFLDKYGQMPMPPYIKRSGQKPLDEERYQTVYSNEPGSVAAPTAGLHFTDELLNKLRMIDVQIANVTLHVGAGTFLPVKTENIDDHIMHSEHYTISLEDAELINKAKSAGRRIIAIGTTAVRAVESAALDGMVQDGEFQTSIFIKPGYKFQLITNLITNFHLPKSTLFILVCSFAGYKRMKRAYEYAIKEKMRFFSYGDAMFLDLDKNYHDMPESI